jgi:hypothetical protein
MPLCRNVVEFHAVGSILVAGDESLMAFRCPLSGGLAVGIPKQ